MSVCHVGASRAYKSLRMSRAPRTASVDLWAREGRVEAILALAVHRSITLHTGLQHYVLAGPVAGSHACHDRLRRHLVERPSTRQPRRPRWRSPVLVETRTFPDGVTLSHYESRR